MASRRWLILVGAAGVLLGLAPLGVRGQDSGPLNVGAAAPKFTLKDQTGVERSLDEFTRKGKVALVFYRSADW